MRTTTLNLKGKDYILCLSLKGIDNLAKRYGSIDNASMAMANPDVCDVIIILAEMMSCGAMYAKLNNIVNPEPLSEEELGYGLDITDFSPIMAKIQETQNLSGEREVETLPNASAPAMI